MSPEYSVDRLTWYEKRGFTKVAGNPELLQLEYVD
jgi:hypothetical protein